MSAPTPSGAGAQPPALSPGLQALRDAVHHAAHLLPAQGPIGVFIHHNTLHAFEQLPFDQAVHAGSAVFHCEPYLPEDRYRDELARGRIRFDELIEVARRDLGPQAHESVFELTSRLDLHLAMLEHPLARGDGPELEWFMAETDALLSARRDVSEVQRRRLITETRHWVMRRLRSSLPGIPRPDWFAPLFQRFSSERIEEWADDRWEAFTLSALWEVCRHGVRLASALPPPPHPPNASAADAPSPPPVPSVRHRDLLLEAARVDTDLLVHEPLIRLCAAFLDQGIAHSTLPGRDHGLFHAFCELYRVPASPLPWWLDGVRELIRDLQLRRLAPLESLQESLEILGVPPAEIPAFLASSLLALRGWAGMIWHIEQRPDRAHHPVPQDSLVEFLAVRLLLERLALRAVARTSLDYRGAMAELRPTLVARSAAQPRPHTDARAFLVFQLAQVLGWTPERLSLFDAWPALLAEIEGFTEFHRRRIFHLAYEHRFRVQTLDALAAGPIPDTAPTPDARPSFQALFCIDEREESIRRHLEEVAPTAETFGAAGFFGVVMYYRGAAAADFVPLCPVVVRPQHWVSETVDRRLHAEEHRRRSTRRRVGMALQSFHSGSRRVVSGAFLSAALGLLATLPLIARVLFPRLTSRFRGFFDRFIAPPPLTRLNLERSCASPGPAEESHGFLVSEMIQIAERLLRDTGLTQRFARIVLIFGHGSTSLNNPHESAHDCGACGGGQGGPNARAVAEILNDPRVRSALADRGIAIPHDTVFVGGIHNTANDNIVLFDIDRVPPSHQFEFEVATRAVDEACIRNAHERARRFGSAPLSIAPAAAKRHMEGRAEDLSQVRPEWGHATNALCIVGRRKKTRGLFLDRRAFLVSYDPLQDDAEATILSRILGAVFPVCSGINLEYYFSYVDSSGWGSGSKLPHNVTGLLGVMDGAMSDLRTGLPWQMVEIHEPVRLLFVIETSPDLMSRIMARQPVIETMVRNRWVQLSVMDPATGQLHAFLDGAFEPHAAPTAPLPRAASSREWYAGLRDHLEFAAIVPSATRGSGPDRTHP